jgi:hypothetical protein
MSAIFFIGIIVSVCVVEFVYWIKTRRLQCELKELRKRRDEWNAAHPDQRYGI